MLTSQNVSGVQLFLSTSPTLQQPTALAVEKKKEQKKKKRKHTGSSNNNRLFVSSRRRRNSSSGSGRGSGGGGDSEVGSLSSHLFGTTGSSGLGRSDWVARRRGGRKGRQSWMLAYPCQCHHHAKQRPLSHRL